MSYPIIAEHCDDLAIGTDSNVLSSENLQVGVGFSYQSFNFVQSADDAAIQQILTCTVSLLKKLFQIF